MAKLLRVAALVLIGMSAFLTSCSATGKFKYVGMPPDWDAELPAPDDDSTVPNTMRVRLYCATLEDNDEFLEQLSDSLRAQMQKAGMGDVSILRDRSKKPHYEIVIYEAGEDGKFDFNEEAGIWTGVGAGVATGIATESLGYGVAAGAGGAAVGGLLFGEKKEVYAFAGVCRQRTALSAVKNATDEAEVSGGAGDNMRDRETGANTSHDDARRALERANWSYETKARERPFMFNISVTGGSMSNKETRDQAAREMFIKRFPKYVTGGSVIG